jgi:anti-sigma factor RsiW
MAGGNPENGHCIRAREWSSLALDGELSELESELLERHLAVCPECHEFEHRLRTATELLRALPPEPPTAVVRLPAARAPFPVRHRRVVVGIAAVVAAATLGSLVGSELQRPAERRGAPQASQVSLFSTDLDQLRQLPRVPHLAPFPRRSLPGGPSEHLI